MLRRLGACAIAGVFCVLWVPLAVWPCWTSAWAGVRQFPGWISHLGFRILAGLFSPAFDCYVAALFSLFSAPLMGLIAVPSMIVMAGRGEDGPRMKEAAGAAALCVAACLFLCALAWGSYPYSLSANGELHMRMIPFIPWPR